MANVVAEPIEYSPLSATKDEIRLLHLQPGHEDAEIYCTIELVSLRDILLPPYHPYEALSYQWSTPGVDDYIYVDYQRLEIKANLLSALKALRLETTTRCLWIDAICINQANTSERNHQVKMMGRIYKGAVNVIVWLGTLSTDPDNDMDERGVFEGLCQDDLFSGINMQRLDITISWTNFDLFSSFSYWSRLWIIQEVLLASRITFQLGHLTCGGRSLEDVFRNLKRLTVRVHEIEHLYAARGYKREWQNHMDKMNSVLNTVPARLFQQRLGYRTRSRKLRPLLSLVMRYRDAECFNVRDKVFGLYNLSKRCCQNAVPVDYIKTVSELGLALIQHHFLKHSKDSWGPSFQVISHAYDLFGILQIEYANLEEEYPQVQLSKNIPSSLDLFSIPCYLRGTILYTCRPAELAQEMVSSLNSRSIPPPEFLSRRTRTHMRSFLKDAEHFLPNVCKPGTRVDLKERAKLPFRKGYHAIVSCIKKESIWREWLFGLALPEHGELWSELPFMFFTADGQIGLSREEFEIGDIVLELDRVNANCIVVQPDDGCGTKLVGMADAVLGAWGPTRRSSLKKMILTISSGCLRQLSLGINARPAASMVFQNIDRTVRPTRSSAIGTLEYISFRTTKTFDIVDDTIY